MADLTIKFPRANYPSLQVGDIGYYADSTNIASNGGISEHSSGEENFVVIVTVGVSLKVTG